MWNTFTGFKHKYDPNFKVDMNLIGIWLNLIESIWPAMTQSLERFDFMVRS